MKDNELQLLTGWGFCKIPYGEKGPRYKDWHKKPYTLEQIPQTDNIGVILGPQSNGILAIDFDGPWAWDYWNEHIKIDFNSFDTVMWTSNKVGRCQMAFSVPKDLWEHIPTVFKKIKPEPESDGKHQALEFRWGTYDVSCQSVLPPSLHPDNKLDPNINYAWLRKPSEVSVCEVPMKLLEWAILDREQENNYKPEVIPYEPKSIDGEEANKIAEELKKYYPTLEYDTWIRVTWGFCNTVGYNDGITIMKYYYPETKKGEYQKLMKSKHNGRVCTIGTIIKMIKDKGGFKKSYKNDDLFYQTTTSRKFI